MARYIVEGTFVDQLGNAVLSGTVSVVLAGTGTAASIYAASSGGTAVNSVTSSSTTGKFTFYVDPADYALNQEFDVIMSKTGYTSQTYYNIHPFPQPVFDNDVGFSVANFGLQSVKTNLDVRATAPDATQRYFVGHFQVYCGTEQTVSLAQTNDKVAVFGGAHRDSSHAANIWGSNFLVEADTGIDSSSVIGCEIDVNNNHKHWASGMSTCLDGLDINSGSTYNCRNGILVNAVGAGKWVRGIHVPHTIVTTVGVLVDSGDGGTVTGAIKGCQIKDGEWGINMRRITDTTPSGYTYSSTDAAVTYYLFAVDAADPSASTTPLRLRVGAEGLLQVKVGAADSAGAGMRHLYVDNA
jgi:hypothetical protein